VDRPTILLVDDVNLIIQLEKSCLRHLPVNILVARNGQEALEMIRQQRPDLIYMDLNMPVMDGPTCCAVIKADPEFNTIPIVMVTTAGREEDEARCRQAGCDDFLTKPIDQQLFLEKGRKFLEDFERRLPRVECRTQVAVSQNGSGQNGVTADISVGGLYVAADQSLPRESAVDLAFSLPGDDASQSIVAKGRVVWENGSTDQKKAYYPPGFGVEFTEIDPDAVSFIEAFVEGTRFKP
jgi:uncharacterized protein (TIGR02266 family)